MDYSVAVVKKSIESLAKKYEKAGYEAKVDWFYSGKGGDWCGSYVTLELEKECKSGERYWYIGKFICNGYTGFGPDEFSTADGLKKAKDAFNKAVENELQYYND